MCVHNVDACTGSSAEPYCWQHQIWDGGMMKIRVCVFIIALPICSFELDDEFTAMYKGQSPTLTFHFAGVKNK